MCSTCTIKGLLFANEKISKFSVGILHCKHYHHETLSFVIMICNASLRKMVNPEPIHHGQNTKQQI